MSKKSAYPNEYFNSVDEYYDFAIKHGVFGTEANQLKKKMDKQSNLIPRLIPPHK